MTPRTDHPAGPAELARMHVLASIDLDNPELRDRLDHLTRRTAHQLAMPISLVSLVLDTAQFLVGAYGIDGWLAATRGTPVEWSFCAHAVASGRPYIVPDTAIDPHQATNPLVTVDGIRSYAGMPLTIDGQTVGAHCVIGATPHAFTTDELDELRHTTDEVVKLLNQYRSATF